MCRPAEKQSDFSAWGASTTPAITGQALQLGSDSGRYSLTKNDYIRDALVIRGTHIGLAIWRMKCFYETFVHGSIVVILLNFGAKNLPHRQVENRY